ESRDGRMVVNDAGRDEKKSGTRAPTVAQRHVETVARAPDARDADAPDVDPVWRQLRAADCVEFGWRDTVAREIAVDGLRPAVARGPEVTQKHASAAAAEHQRGTQASRSAPYDDDVERHQSGECKTATTTRMVAMIRTLCSIE